ncbi:MAG: sigma-70 family RNA polymerase sigma factor [Myxococcota bacterium]
MAEHGPRVWAMCLRLAADPEDCYQAVWEKVLGALDGFDPDGPAPIGAWIATIARRHLVDQHRRRRIRGQVVSLAGLASGEPDVADALHRHHREQRLEAAIARLPDAHRRVVVLHHIHGVPLEVLSAEEACPWGRSSRGCTAGARLAELLGDED